ncbi:hypothetical protein E2C01_082160 [Portunus trituberculatus]|uniref:Uncharacterized protein n=1 Tax=Portunus trituberculatus TaxID=210409 RepID=A0A5B7ITT1_PORTR|nr:hypothetical protein [Portunus trituberculatus]
MEYNTPIFITRNVIRIQRNTIWCSIIETTTTTVNSISIVFFLSFSFFFFFFFSSSSSSSSSFYSTQQQTHIPRVTTDNKHYIS